MIPFSWAFQPYFFPQSPSTSSTNHKHKQTQTIKPTPYQSPSLNLSLNRIFFPQPHTQTQTIKPTPIKNPRHQTIKPTKPPIRNPRRRFETHRNKPIQKKSSSEPPLELPMINPTDPPTDQQIHHFKPTINRSQPIDPNLARRSTTNDPLQPQHTSVTTQPRPKHRTQPQPTTPLSTGHSQKKKKQPPQ